MVENYREVFAKRLKEERKKRGWSQTVLAKLLNVKSISSVTNWENMTSVPDYGNLCSLADVFEVSVDYLLGRTDIRKDNRGKGQDVRHLDDVDRVRLEKITACDEYGQAAIDNCIDFQFKRIVEEAERAEKKLASFNEEQKKRIFLVEGKDADYEEMKKRIQNLRALKKKSKKTFATITNYLLEKGYGEEICVAFIMNAFGYGLTPRVPSKELYDDIVDCLMGRFQIVSDKRADRAL